MPGEQLSVNDAEMGSRSDTFARLRTVQVGTALIERPADFRPCSRKRPFPAPVSTAATCQKRKTLQPHSARWKSGGAKGRNIGLEPRCITAKLGFQP